VTGGDFNISKVTRLILFFKTYITLIKKKPHNLILYLNQDFNLDLKVLNKMIRLFEDEQHAKIYRKFRPKAPNVVVEKSIQYLKKRTRLQNCADKFQLMVDVGCGSGQTTEPFASYFEKIIGIDASASQIACAPKKFPHIEYLVGKGESIPVDDESVDLITCGAAVHWLDFPVFLGECHRVLKPNGCLLLYNYDYVKLYPQFKTSLKKEEIIASELKAKSNFLKTCRFHSIMRNIGDHYKVLFDVIQSDNKERTENIEISADWTLDDVKNHFRSLSGYQTMMREKLENLKQTYGEEITNEEFLLNHDPCEEFSKELKCAWKIGLMEDSDVRLKVTWDHFMLLSDRPRNL